MTGLLKELTWLGVLDIVILSVLFYYLFLALRGTRGVQLLKGLVLIFIAAFLSRLTGLQTLYWFLEKLLAFGALAVLIIFQPEFRTALIRLAEPDFFGRSAGLSQDKLAEIVGAAYQMARERIGALIVIERRVGLADQAAGGTLLNAEISKSLLRSIFNPSSPLHDGAVIVGNGRLAAAGCILPLSDRPDLDQRLGTRHRAALGISEQSDGLAIVVSQERGTVSLVRKGRIYYNLDQERISRIIEKNLQIKPSTGKK